MSYPKVCTAKFLAETLDVDERTIRKFVRDGIVVRADKGLYRFEESVQGYVRHLKNAIIMRVAGFGH
jgi:hypothetical protein